MSLAKPRFFSLFSKSNPSKQYDKNNFINSKIIDNLLLAIFKYLSINDQLNIRVVCKKWRHMIDYLLLNRNDLVIKKKGNDQDFQTMNNFKKLSKLDYVYFNNYISYNMIEQLLGKCLNLTTLCIDSSQSKIDIKVADLLKEKCWSKLENLILQVEDCDFIGDLIDPIIVKCGNNLKFCELHGKVDTNAIRFLIRNSPNLNSFAHIVQPYLVSPQKCFYFHDKLEQLYLTSVTRFEDVEDICNSECKNLKRLHIKSRLFPGMLPTICQSFQLLNDIHFNCHHLARKELKVIPKKLHQLEKVHLTLAYGLKCDKILINLMKKNNKLTIIDIDGFPQVTDNSIKYISFYCPFIERLTIPDSYDLTDESLIAISKLNNLKELCLSGVNSITNDGLITIINNCHLLNKIIIVSFSGQITNKFRDYCLEYVKQRPTKKLDICKRTEIDMNDIILPENLNFEI